MRICCAVFVAILVLRDCHHSASNLPPMGEPSVMAAICAELSAVAENATGTWADSTAAVDSV